jgi:cell division protein FtsB
LKHNRRYKTRSSRLLKQKPKAFSKTETDNRLYDKEGPHYAGEHRQQIQERRSSMRTLILVLTVSALMFSVPLTVTAGSGQLSFWQMRKAGQEQMEKIRAQHKAIEAEAAKVDEPARWSPAVKPKSGK